ncbi:MAG: nitrile hydratase subunit beta [Acidimicrobiales bacterium]
MDGVHDLGGLHGFGPVDVEADEPVFHHDWERSARALVYAVMVQVPNPSGSMFRHAIERMEPAHYLTSPYYEHWLTAAATMAVEAHLVEQAELEAAAGGPFPLSRPGSAVLLADEQPEARFAVGDRVRVRNLHPPGHTRCPRYVRGRIGEVVRRDGAYPVPDVEAHSPRRPVEETYCVRFEASELWDDGQVGVSVSVGLWDSYLEPVA